MSRPLRLLLVEDSAEDAQLLIGELRRCGYEPAYEVVETAAALESALADRPWDLVISDYRMPAFSGAAALGIVRERCTDLPFIVVSGTVGEETAVEMLKAGADDYLLKDRMGRLSRAVAHELEKQLLRRENRRAEAELRLTQERLRRLLEHSPGVIYSLAIAGSRAIPQVVSENVFLLLGFTVAEALSLGWWEERLHPADRDRAVSGLGDSMRCRDVLTEYRLRHRQGHYVWVEDSRRTIADAAGRPVEIAGVWTDISRRKDLEAELTARERQLGSFFTGAPAGLALFDPELRFVRLNETLAQMNGVPLASHLGRTWDDVFPGLARQVQPALEEVLASGRPVPHLELAATSPRAPGVPRHWVATSFPVAGSDATPAGVGCIVVEVTELRRAETALRESEARAQMATAAANIGFWDWNLVDGSVYLSPEWKAQLGYADGEIPNRFEEWHSRVHPDDVAATDSTLQPFLAGATAGFAADFRLRHRDGTWRWIFSKAQLVRDAAGRPVRMLGCNLDITERKEAMLALNESRQLLEQAQAVAHIGSWVTHPSDHDRVVWSAETCRIFGLPPGQFEGTRDSFLERVHPDDRDRVIAAARAVWDGTQAYDLEHRIVRADGEVRWVHERAHPERDAEGRPMRLVGVAQDITERKHLEEQLRQAQKMEAIGQLAGGIAHDFNNILGAILGNAELIRLLPAGSEKAAECLDDIVSGGRRAGELVRQILAFSRRQETRREPVELRGIVEEALRLLRATVPATVTFRTSLARVPTVLANASEIHQVTMNLCTNAWHSLRDQCGVITVELAGTEVDAAFARRQPDLRPGPHVRLSFTDNGCGMSAETRSRIFEPFFTTKPVGLGTGLGLAVVHGIVRSHDGIVVVRSEPGAGSTFDLYFPVFGTEARGGNDAAVPVVRGSGQHILLADDETLIVRMATSALERLGYRVTAHAHPAAALAAFTATPDAFDLAILDYNMPGMNGAALAARMLECRADARLLLATGYGEFIDADSARAIGFRGLVMKPYDLHDLGDALHRALTGAGPVAANAGGGPPTPGEPAGR